MSFKNLLAILAATFVFACAEGTAVVTGERRPPTNPEQIQLFTTAPNAEYEIIAFLNASSANGWTDQQSLEYAIAELRNQAASVGANGIILNQPSSQLGGFVMSGNVAIPYDEQSVSGSAIYIFDLQSRY